MKRYFFKTILGLICFIGLYTEIACSNSAKRSHLSIIRDLTSEKDELIHKNQLCNGINLGLSTLTVTAGLATVIGYTYEDPTLLLTGLIGTIVLPVSLITTHCINCCQNRISVRDIEYGDI